MRLNDSVIAEKRSWQKRSMSALRTSKSTGSLSRAGPMSSVYKTRRNVVTEDQNRLRYWNSFTVIYARKENAHTIKEALEKKRQDWEKRKLLKWRETSYLHRLMRMPQYRRPGMEDFDKLTKCLQLSAAERKMGPGPVYNLVCREDFVSTILALYEIANVQHVNRFFSGFDLERKDEADIRAMLGALRILWRNEESAADKLDALFRIWDLHNVQANANQNADIANTQTAPSESGNSRASGSQFSVGRKNIPGALQGSLLDRANPSRLHKSDLLQMLLTCAVTQDEIQRMERCMSSFERHYTCENQSLPGYMRKHAKHEHITYNTFCMVVETNVGNMVEVFTDHLRERIPGYKPPNVRPSTTATQRTQSYHPPSGMRGPFPGREEQVPGLNASFSRPTSRMSGRCN